MNKGDLQAIPKDFDLTQVESSEEVTQYLTNLSQYANTSVAAALKAQIQVIKYINSPDLCGSAFDLFFKNLKRSVETCQDEEQLYEIREKAALMLNNFIFFTKAKIEWEISVNRKLGEQLLEQAAHGLAESVLDIASLAVPGGGAAKAAVKAKAVLNLQNIFFSPDIKGDNLFKKVWRWATKNSRAARKETEFIIMLDGLVDKLVNNAEFIGPNNLIAGMIQNYKRKLMDYYSYEWRPYFSEAYDAFEKLWQVPIWILSLGAVANLIVGLCRWVYSVWHELGHNWFGIQWIWYAMICGGASVICALIFLIIGLSKRAKGNSAFNFRNNYYNDIINYFSE